MNKELLVDLLIKSQNNDSLALEKLCRISEQFVRNYFLYKFKDLDTVNDLCQETFARLIKSIPNVREPAKYKNFVLKTAFFVMQDFLRKKATLNNQNSSFEDLQESNFSLADQDIILDEKVISKIDLANALKELPQKSQYILQLQSEGYKYQEIAEKLGLSESAIKMQVKRSLQKLCDLLSL